MLVTGLLFATAHRGSSAHQNSSAPSSSSDHCSYFLSRGCLRGSACELVHDPDALAEFHKRKYRESEERNRERARVESLYGRAEGGKGLSLLEKLLEEEVRKEGGMTVACLRALVDADFLRGGGGGGGEGKEGAGEGREGEGEREGREEEGKEGVGKEGEGGNEGEEGGEGKGEGTGQIV